MLKFSDLIETAIAFADNNMHTQYTANKMYVTHSSVVYRLRKLHKMTGLNPYNFYELHEILEKYGEGVEND